MTEDLNDLNNETREAWNTNAQVWDTRMGDEGNDFFQVLQWPAITRLLRAAKSPEGERSRSAKPLENQHILDIACGNGLTTRRLAELGAKVTAFDFSKNLIEMARNRSTDYGSRIAYHVIDATDESALLSLGERKFDSALSNMALFDMAELEPLFRVLPKLLKPNGMFVFSITHPAFNNASAAHVAEEIDDEGVIKTVYSVKVSRYITPYHQHGLALYSQPKPQVYFERPLQYYLNLAFENGFVMDGFEERAFPPEIPQKLLEWGGKFSEIPPVIVARFRLLS